ncbi:MAG: DUF5018 domain-containing protein [Imperialibacter sp.]|uniref:DUF5018 domain-containing protein n=1 Tax=Imperialibacter sp. TaxID=2038411 RepID=UPI0032EF199A
MKTFYKLKTSCLSTLALLGVFAFFSSQKARAQVTGGTYTVGTGGNYTTLQDAFNDISPSNPFTADVVFELKAGYTSSTDLSVTSPPNYLDYSLTVKPAADVTFIELNHDITFSGERNVIFDGAHPVSGDRVIQLNGVITIQYLNDGITIKNMKINMVDRYGIYCGNNVSSTAHWHNVTIEGNEFFTETPLDLTGNIYAIISYPTSTAVSQWPTNFRVENNLFHKIERTNNSGNVYAIYVRNALRAYNNYIHLTHSTAMPTNIGIHSDRGDIEVMHNTILFDGGNTSSRNSSVGINNGAIYSETNGKIQNNLISIQSESDATGGKTGIFAGSFSAKSNNIYIKDDGVSTIKYYSNTAGGDKAAALAYDATTTFAEPSFTDAVNGDLSLAGASLTNPDFRSSFITTVTEDIEGTTRHPARPSKGAFEAPNMVADILTFSHAGQYEYAIIDNSNSTVFQEVTTATNLSAVTPTITTYYGATISPLTGVTRNFTSPVTYTVTAEDGVTTDTWTVTLVHKNDAPTDIILSNADVDENTATGTVIGIFSTTDADGDDTHVYTLVGGTGSTDNGSFTIDGSNLKVNTSLDFETKTSYSIRVRTDDQVAYGGTFEKVFTISVNDLPDETPSAISIDNLSLDEGAPAGTTVGLLSTEDLDAGDEHTYTLASGTGDANNSLFDISGDKLISKKSFDFNMGSSYSVRIRSTDNGANFTEEAFTIAIKDFSAGAQGISGSQLQKIVASDRRTGDNFGGAGAISGNYAIVGSTNSDFDENGANYVNGAGAAYIFEKQENGTWEQVQKLVAPIRTGYLFFGYSVSISGNYAVVGVPNDEDQTTGNSDGAAYVYERNASGTWELINKLVPSDGQDEGVEFGTAVAISGERLVVTALYEYYDENGMNYADDAGAAYVFERNESGEWVEVQKIVASDRGTRGYYFGESAAISGDYLAIGAPESYSLDTDGTTEIESTGAIYVFERNESGVWAEVQKLTAAEGEEYDYAGYAIAMSGETIVMTDENKDFDESTSDAGAVYVFSRSAGGAWEQSQTILFSTPFEEQYFGRSVAIENETLMISAERMEKSVDLPAVFIYSKNSEGEWVTTGTLTSSDGTSNDDFGGVIAVDGQFALITSERDSEDAEGLNFLSSAGSAYLFSLCENPDLPEITASDAEICQGTTVTLSVGDAVLNGATSWEWYAGDCDGTFVGSGASVEVSPTSTTTYYVRGEGGCADQGICAFITIEVFETCPEANIVTFELEDQLNNAIINRTAHTVTLEVPTEVDVTTLAPTVTVSFAATISPASGVVQDFSAPVTYTVTAEDLSTQPWTVTVLRVLSSANDILAFELDEQTGDALIDSENHTVAIEVALGTNLSALIPTVTTSFGATVSPAGGTSVDLSLPTVFTVTSEDGSPQEWTITVTEAPNTGTDILSFALVEQTGDAAISITNHTVAIEVAYGTSLSTLTPTITISDEASIDPESGIEQDFTNPVGYVVTAENGNTQDWTVTVTIAPNTASDILTFVLAEQTGDAVIDAENHTIGIGVPYGTDLTALTPTITVSDQATIDPTNEAAVDFSSAVIYTVTAGDGSTQEWTVTITPAMNSATDILTFVLAEQTGDAVIDAENHTVGIGVPYGTDLTALTPTITVSEQASIDPTNETAADFSSAVVYTVTAGDGTTQEWIVTVTPAMNSATDILTFVLAEQIGDAVIDAENHSVSVTVATGTDATVLAPTITVSNQATISPASGAAQDFAAPVTYTVTAGNGATQEWTVTVTVEPAPLSSASDILTFSLPEETGPAVIDATAHTVAIEVVAGTNVSSLTPTITISAAASISPASGAPQDFTSAVVYTVTAEDGSTQEWTVTVTVAPATEPLSSAKDIISFLLHKQTGDAVINTTDHTVTIEVEVDADITSLSPAITVSDKASVSPGSEVAQDFSAAVVYTVTAEDGSTQEWTVTVTVEEGTKTGIPEVFANLSVYPNPTVDKVHISGLVNGTELRLINLSGTVLNQVSQSLHDTESISLAGLTGGVYVLQVSTEGKVKSYRIIKE